MFHQNESRPATLPKLLHEYSHDIRFKFMPVNTYTLGRVVNETLIAEGGNL
ncbi:MAG: DUF2268 domain-containing protein [Leptolyngbya sp. SIO1D8]|nr:DUF2268 domain-containing protein [Leptolyngbya sp. SIO1D8]